MLPHSSLCSTLNRDFSESWHAFLRKSNICDCLTYWNLVGWQHIDHPADRSPYWIQIFVTSGYYHCCAALPWLYTQGQDLLENKTPRCQTSCRPHWVFLQLISVFCCIQSTLTCQQSMMLSPPCFTLGMLCFWWWCLVRWPKSSMLVFSDHRILFQLTSVFFGLFLFVVHTLSCPSFCSDALKSWQIYSCAIFFTISEVNSKRS